MTESRSVLSWEVIEQRDYNDALGNFWGDGYVQYFDCDHDFTCTYVKTYKIVPFKYVQFMVCQLYSKAV